MPCQCLVSRWHDIGQTNNMTEAQQTQFIALLELFIADSGLDQIEACRKAQELLAIINE